MINVQSQSIRDELIDFGFNKLQANVYAKFITTVFDALFSAESRVKAKENWENILLKEGALLKERNINGKSITPTAEEAITAELHVQLDHIKIEADVNHTLREMYIEFRLDPPIPSDTKTGKNCKRPDLVAKAMHFSTQGVELFVEAKNVFSLSDVKNHYFGTQGTVCFTRSEDSYRCKNLGAMLGYTISETEQYWLGKINAIASDHTKHSETHQHIVSETDTRPILTLDFPIEAQSDQCVKLFNMIMKFNTLENE